MQAYIVNASNPLAVISGTFDPTSCTVENPGLATGDDIGFYIEGLSILANVTANHTYTQMYVASAKYASRLCRLTIPCTFSLDELIPAIVTYRRWHDADGILTQCTH